MSFYDNHYYYINKMLLSLVGQWPFQSRMESNVMLVITLFLSCSFTSLQIWGLIAGIRDLNIIMETASPLFISILVLLKLINCLCNKDKMKHLLKRIEETWKRIQIGPENKILQNHAEQNRTLIIKYASTLYILSTLYSTMPVVVKTLHSLLPTNETYATRFLFRLDHVLDVDKYFNLLMLNGILGIFFLMSVWIAADGMFILCTQHVCALFEAVQYNVKRIQGSDFVIDEPNIMDDEAYHVIISCIKSYEYALKFSELLSSTYATHFLFLLGNVVVAVSFSVAELIMMDIPLDETVRLTACNIGLLLHIFYLSLMAQQIIDYSDKFQEVIYSCNWYKISQRSKKLLRFTLLRASKPCQIKAGKMFVMSMENFSSLQSDCFRGA
ncbi:odorant receptor 9a isoform X2 [Camponotus floridanus]|uniref:odorant receptor 9a isoform X2 n=1 Tax=Camponotus floridanus TaxID=104421 RepID=UPI000DC6BDE8|nr:odorant receptor 9a isoform X2 [Camponotus floridanus]